jgi:DNA-binding NarL/FixJ family response regulator
MLELSDRLRVLLADDHKPILERVKGLLDSDFEVVGAVDNGQALVAMARELSPNVAVVDIEMPVLDGLEALRQLRQLDSQMKVVFLTVHEDPDLVSMCFQAGALGYVIKSRLASDLIPAIRSASANRTFVSPTLPRFGA